MADERTFVIVGASLTGAKAAESLRAEGFAGRIVLVGEEPDLPYERPPLSKGYLMGHQPRDKAYLHDGHWYSKNKVELVLGTRVTRLDPKAHTVTLDGAQTVHYDRVLLATGSRVRRLELPGSDNSGVRYLRTITESDAILSDLRAGANVVVLGAGWIGLEVAAAARTHGCSVHLVQRGDLPLKRVLGPELARLYANLHEARGVTFHPNTGIREFGGVGGRLSQVTLNDDTELPADLAVLGVGITPATELAEAAGLHVDDGIVTNNALRTSDPDIFAAGDVASFDSPLLGQRIRVEHWANALNAGTSVARSMLGLDMVYDWLPYFYSDQYDGTPSISMEYAGYIGQDGYDQLIVRGHTTIKPHTNPEFVAFWVRDGRVLAGMNANVWDEQEHIQALVRSSYQGRPVDLAKLADPDVPLTDLLTRATRN